MLQEREKNIESLLLLLLLLPPPMLFSFTFPKYDCGNKIPRETDAKRRERERERERKKERRESQRQSIVFLGLFLLL